MKVAILNYQGAVATSVAGPFDILDQVANISKAMGVTTRITFDVDIVDADDVSSRPYNMKGNSHINGGRIYDLIIVPAMHFNFIEKTLKDGGAMVEWIQYQYSKGSDVCSICLGAFLLAETGLLDGKKATTHWMGMPMFEKAYPAVNLQPDKVIVDEGRVYTCGAAYSFTSLMLYLVEKFCGRDMALAASRVFMIQVHQAGQNSFSIFNLQQEHHDKTIREVQRFISENYNSRLNVKQLGERFNMSQRSFIRRFKEHTGNTPLEYIQRVKVEAAKRKLEQGGHTVEEISMDVGYDDFNSFRNIFKRFTGLTPQDYKKKYYQMFTEAIVG